MNLIILKECGIYIKVSRQEATSGKHKVITTRWIDTNKGDKDNPNYGSRPVGREIKKDNRLDLFAATPPLEALEYIISKCACNPFNDDPYVIMVNDTKRAYCLC